MRAKGLRSVAAALVLAWAATFIALPGLHSVGHDDGDHVHLDSGEIVWVDEEGEDLEAEHEHEHEDDEDAQPPSHGWKSAAHLAAAIQVANLVARVVAPLEVEALELLEPDAPIEELRVSKPYSARAPPSLT
jgi:hypothetical protein